MRSLLLVLLLASPAVAEPIRYTIHFTTEQQGIPPTGSFTYDAQEQRFSDFQLQWTGLDVSTKLPVSTVYFDFTYRANFPLYVGQAPCLNGATGAAASFALISGNCPNTFWRMRFATQDLMSIAVISPFMSMEAYGGVESIFITGMGSGSLSISEDQPETFGEPVEVSEAGSVLLLLSGLALMACQYGYVKRR